MKDDILIAAEGLSKEFCLVAFPEISRPLRRVRDMIVSAPQS